MLSLAKEFDLFRELSFSQEGFISFVKGSEYPDGVSGTHSFKVIIKRLVGPSVRLKQRLDQKG